MAGSNMMLQDGLAYMPAVGPNVMAPVCYWGVDQNTPLGKMVDTAFNLQFTTVVGVVSRFEIAISTWAPWFLHSIYVFGATSSVLIKPYDGNGEEIFTDFFLAATLATDPFPLLTPYFFRPNDNLFFDVQDLGAPNICEVIFRGYTLS